MIKQYILLTAIVFILFVGGTVAYLAKSPQKTPSSFNAPSITLQSASCHAIQENKDDPESFIPDPSCTPGSTNPEVTQDNIQSTICVRGYTKTIRPPLSYTAPLKIQSIKDYGYRDTNPKDYELDHMCPLEAGCSPTDPKNLWAEILTGKYGAHAKDKVENWVHSQICSGKMTLQQGQDVFLKNQWPQIIDQQGF